MVFARIAARRLSLPRQNLLRLSNVNPTSISGKAFNAARCLSTTGVRRAEIAGVTQMVEDKFAETGMGFLLGIGAVAWGMVVWSIWADMTFQTPTR